MSDEDHADHQVSALIRLLEGHTVEELLEILKGKKEVSVREISPGALTFNGPESSLKAVELIACVVINVNHQLYPDFF